MRAWAGLAAAGWLSLGVAPGFGVAVAQIAPPSAVNPGLIGQQNKRNQQQLQQQVAPPPVGPSVVAPPPPPGTAVAPGGPTFLLKRVVFDNSKFLSKQELDAVAAKYIGTQIDLATAQRMVKAVNDLYAAKGIVTASASLPPQTLDDGVLHIALVEGRLGKMTVKGKRALSSAYLLQRIPAAPGEVVDLPALADRVAAFNKTGVAQVQALLQPGAQFGLTDIQLAVTEPPVNSLDLFVDDQGVSSVGRYEGGFLYQRYAPFHIDDKFTLYGVFAGGNVSGDAAYSLPFDPSGGRLGASVSYGGIHVIDGPYRDLDIRGTSLVAAGNISQPVFVNQKWLVLLNGAFTYFSTNSTQSKVQVTRDQTYRGAVGFTVDYADPLGAANLATTYSWAQTDGAITGIVQNFELYSGVYSGLLHFPGQFDATVSGAFQVSSASLLSGDQLFQVGGPTTVRGYASDAVAGATGYYAQFELHHNLNFISAGTDFFVFYDRGAAYNPAPAVTILNSVGLGLTFNLAKYGIAELSAGFPVTQTFDKQPVAEVYFRLTAKFR